jgi:putative tricarboxylic transport membrane protein
LRSSVASMISYSRSLALKQSRSLRINWVALCTGLSGAFAAGESIRLGLGELRNPGPGLFIFMASSLLTLFSVALLFEEIPPSANWKALFTKRRIAVTASFFSPVLMLEDLGFRLTISLLLIALLPLFGFRKWAFILGIAVLTGVASHLFFSKLLGMFLPTGPWGI